MVFNFSLTQKLSPFFLLPEGQLCFWNFSFLTESVPYISQGSRNSRCSKRLQYQQIIHWYSARKEKTDPVLSLKHGWDTSLDSKSENKYRSDLYFGDSRACLFFVCNYTRASGNFICLSSHGKILAESFQFDWKENIFYKLEIYVQPDCMMTNQPSQTEFSECHDREKRSFQHFPKRKLEFKKYIFEKPLLYALYWALKSSLQFEIWKHTIWSGKYTLTSSAWQKFT